MRLFSFEKLYRILIIFWLETNCDYLFFRCNKWLFDIISCIIPAQLISLRMHCYCSIISLKNSLEEEMFHFYRQFKSASEFRLFALCLLNSFRYEIFFLFKLYMTVRYIKMYITYLTLVFIAMAVLK